jgi:transposase
MVKYFLGGDISKGYGDFIILDDQKAVSEQHFILDDTADGHQQLHQVVKNFFTNHPNAVLYAAVESTGGYENNWYKLLTSMGNVMPVKTARLNARGVRHHQQAGLKRTGTDKISATAIAEYQINYPEVIEYDKQDKFKSMKRLYTVYRALVKARTQLKNQMETLLYAANPELVQYRKDNTPKWLLRLLKEYPVADDLAAATIEDLAAIPYVTAQRAEQLIAAAKNNIASATDPPTQVAMRVLVNQILEMDRGIREVEKEAIKFVDVPEIALLTTAESVGPMSAIGLFIELGGCVAAFPRVKKLSSFWGIHPLLKDSGDGTFVSRMSKQGRKMPRAILFMVVLNGIRSDSYIRKIYRRELAKGKCKMSAIGVCMHKMARIIYGMLKNYTPFDPEIDKHNQERSVPKKETAPTPSQARRFQKEDQQAPISRRQTKKRKEREQSQSKLVAVSEINVPAPSSV